MKLLYNLLRKDMIKRMLKAGWKEQRINTVLSALRLAEIAKKKKREPIDIYDDEIFS